MNVLIIGQDPALFDVSDEAVGDAGQRHRLYAELLRRTDPSSSVRVLSYPPRAPMYRDVHESGLSLYPTRSWRRELFILDAVLRLPAILRGWRPDLITTQTLWEEGLLGWWLGRLLKVPFLPQVHFDLLSHLWRTESPLNPLRLRIAGVVARHCTAIRVVSTTLKRNVVERWGLREDRVLVVPVGVRFQPAPPTSKDWYRAKISPRLVGQPVVLFVGRLVAQKNLHLWLDVAREVRRRVPAQFVIAGHGPLLDSLKAYVNREEMGDCVHFLGSVGHRQLPEVYAAADVLLLTSHYEGFGRVILEAFLAGVPVVATACTGPEDLVESGTSGFLLTPGDARGLADAVASVLADPRKAAQMGEAGRDTATRQFSRDGLAARLVDRWRTVAEDGDRASSGPRPIGRR